MLPLTILAVQKFSNLLTNGNALQSQIESIATATVTNVPSIDPAQVVLSSASPDIGDRNIQLMYPRVCLYTTGIKNDRTEKFRSFSGTVGVSCQIWASANMVSDTDQWIHYYVEAITSILRESMGDWGDGISFSGVYDVSFQPPKPGGLGFVESAIVTCSLSVSRN